jgi:hypothetical protein
MEGRSSDTWRARAVVGRGQELVEAKQLPHVVSHVIDENKSQ